MQTNLADYIKDTEQGREADAILRKCVHCGFCLATCPTYQLLGDELDSPRGRIYLIKQVLEGHVPTGNTQLHLDRCLTCRNCETTCPSGVEYGRLADIGRQIVETQVERPLPGRLVRRCLRLLLPYRRRFGTALWLGRLVRPLLPAKMKRGIPPPVAAGSWPDPAASSRHDRSMLVLQGCVQPAIDPGTNTAAARVLDRLGIRLEAPADVCCGAVSYHLAAAEEGKDFMRRNIDVWWPYIERGAEAVVLTASGCGAMVKEYGEILRGDPDYAGKAARVSELARDLSEVVAAEDRSSLGRASHPTRVAFHPPCTLQHGQKIRGVVERILADAGYELTAVPDAHLCCGSAGTYSILQKGLAGRLKSNKLEALQQGGPDVIATANIGCQTHLQSGTGLPVKHWIELLDVG